MFAREVVIMQKDPIERRPLQLRLTLGLGYDGPVLLKLRHTANLTAFLR